MSETKWTPGPWEVFSNMEVSGPRVCKKGISSGDIKLCHRWVLGAWKDDPEAHANMYLIAAAPQLYEALEMALEMLKQYEDSATGEDFNSPKINAALAAARGEKP